MTGLTLVEGSILQTGRQAGTAVAGRRKAAAGYCSVPCPEQQPPSHLAHTRRILFSDAFYEAL